MRPTSTSAIQVLLSYLDGEGVQYIFGIPGGPLMPLYEGIFEQRRIQPIIAKHEEGAAFMADGYARVSGGLGVCCTTTGPGATNALTGISVARIDSVPVLILTAQIAISAFGKGAAQESSVHGIDSVELYKLVTKASVMLQSPEKMPDTVRMLLRRALGGRPGPVHLSLPADMVKRTISVEHFPPEQYRAEEFCFDRGAIRRACELLIQARKPAILAGSGVYMSRGWQELRQLAERLRIPVASTPKAKGIFPEDHGLALGVFGLAGTPQSEKYLLNGDVDVLLAVGTSFAEASTHCWNEKLRPSHALIQIDIDSAEIGKNYPVNVGVCGDAKTVLMEMLFQIERELRLRKGPDLAAREIALEEHKAEYGWCVRPEGFDDMSVPLKPQRLMREIEEALPPETILFVDIGNVMAWAIHYLRITRPGSFFINMGFGSMGHAVAACIGGKLAAPERPVIALVGDAAFAMNGTEVHTAVENEIPVIWVVMNNGGHGMVCHGERLQFNGRFSTGKFRYPLDIAGMAQAMGAQGLRVEQPGEFGDALAQAIQSQRPTVIDALIDPAEFPPLSLRIETLEKFFNAEGAGGNTPVAIEVPSAPPPFRQRGEPREPEIITTRAAASGLNISGLAGGNGSTGGNGGARGNGSAGGNGGANGNGGAGNNGNTSGNGSNAGHNGADALGSPRHS